jgi:hypothetical protein
VSVIGVWSVALQRCNNKPAIARRGQPGKVF